MKNFAAIERSFVYTPNFDMSSSTRLIIPLLGIFSFLPLHAQLDAGSERAGSDSAGDDRAGTDSAGDDRAGTETGGSTLSGDPGWDGDPPVEDDGDPVGTGMNPDTFHDECTYDLAWDRSQGGTGGNGSQFLSMDLSYNDDGAGGAHRVSMSMTMDVTRSQNEGWDTGVFSFVLNNGSAVNLGSEPATNAMIVIDPNAGMSVYEYDVNPCLLYTSPSPRD